MARIEIKKSDVLIASDFFVDLIFGAVDVSFAWAFCLEEYNKRDGEHIV